MAADAPLIVTLAIQPQTAALLDGMRRRHFPAARNFIGAHITLFHHLPGDREAEVAETLRAACAAQGPFEIVIGAILPLRRGTALRVAGDRLAALREELATRFRPWLIAQDRQAFRPHVTLQNKVMAHEARALQEDLAGSFTPIATHATGLDCWHYLGGPWRQAGHFRFG